MPTKLLPENETLRLMTLKSLDIFDSRENDRFDRLTRLSKRMFNVPIALVTLIDADSQIMKSCVGVEPMDLPRTISFCSHAIMEDKVFVVPDMLEDDRFRENPLVVEQGVRFYAGCPIKALNGSRLGTLCIVDVEPREFSAEDSESLSDLAAMVELEIAAIEIAINDKLTNVLNRRGFDLIAFNGMELCRRNDLPACMAYIDLNKFKIINDQFGHAEGDYALISVANIAKENIRKTDVLARLGGDEFAIFFIGTTLEQAERVCEKLRLNMERHNKESKKPYQLTFSVGIVVFRPNSHTNIEDMLNESDMAMYDAKMAIHPTTP